MVNKRESAFFLDKTERDTETFNLALSNVEMKLAKTNQTCFFYAIKPRTAWFKNEKSKNLVVREIRLKTALFNCE